MAALPGAAEPDQVRGDSTRTGQELDPVVRARGNPVQVQRWHARGVTGVTVENGRLVELDRVLIDAHPPARITSGRVSGTSPDQRPSPASPPPGAPTLCLGDAVVGLICEGPLGDVSAA